MAIVGTRYKRVLIGVANCRSSSMPATSAGGGGEGPRGREPPRRYAATNVSFDNSIAQSCRSARHRPPIGNRRLEEGDARWARQVRARLPVFVGQGTARRKRPSVQAESTWNLCSSRGD